MSYRQMKWLILIIPTITIGLWEYVRHEYLLNMISMNLGNWLSPVIVFAVTITLLRMLFRMMESMQEELKSERAVKAALEEREIIARELHDGIAQTLFLLSVKIEQLEKANDEHAKQGHYQPIKKTVYEINEYVRQAITSLRYPPLPDKMPWMKSVHQLIEDFENDTGIKVSRKWTLPEERLLSKEKIEIYAFIREALLNVRKHSEANHVWIEIVEMNGGFSCTIEDDGKGIDANLDISSTREKFGLKIMKERAEKMGWSLALNRNLGKTVLEMKKG